MTLNDTPTRTRNAELAQAYLHLMKEQEWDAWIELWTDDAVLEFPFAPTGGKSRLVGKMDILQYMRSVSGRIVVLGVKELKMHPMLDPEQILVELQIEGRIPATGAPYDQRYVTLFTFKGGRLAHYREYWNPLVSIEAYGSYEAWLAQATASRD